MRIIYICMLFAFIACGKKNDPPASGLSIASIPQGCNVYTTGGSSNGQGWHGFPDNNLLLVTAFDCGMREGKRCFYYLTVDMTKNDTICQVP